MPDILAVLTCLIFELDNTTYRQFGYIISAMLAMSGRVTMKGISRWAGKGGSYRTVQRFFSHPHNWPTVMWLFFQTHCFSGQQTYAIAGDEVVTTKSGNKTYGVDWFFSSVSNRPVKGLAFFALSLVGLSERQSFPVRIEQVVKSDQLNKTPSTVKSKPKTKIKLNMFSHRNCFTSKECYQHYSAQLMIRFHLNIYCWMANLDITMQHKCH